MNILLIGSGGREHALAWKLAQSRLLAGDGDQFYAAPGNPGIAEHAECVALDAGDHAAVLEFCSAKAIGLVAVGPEAPLVNGLGDALRNAGIPVFGPNQGPAQLEGSKGFTKDLCERAGIPTAGYVRTTSLDEAITALDRFSPPYVLKADGLAAGKGVVLPETREEAEAALEDMFGGRFGAAGAEVVIEEFMVGEEASFFALTDGTAILPLGSAQDHKRVGEGDTGPNTGGMGAYSPAPVLTAALQQDVMDRIITPTVDALRAEGTPYSGVLFAGLMLTDKGPKLIEYNARFGDPECQVLMMRLEEDLGELMLACAEGKLSEYSAANLSSETALTVVMAANGYPGTPEKGGAIQLGSAETSSAKVFHAGTKIEGEQLRANGGRVLNVTAMGANVTQAQTAAYAAVDAITFPTGFCRRDIGWREVERESPA
ncbi:phosphoribosylamine--glycine ligase [Parerythrobacter jejuensis]|uniref:Phosphoribosylamine--glycine ligase n=1 Tax=Parerythrobacter jejuensis TaxID=795812 RepID=A0A845AQ51_9SPHN|nr:phosphoribosylamine--glycine ligase [Parerythrobacter jejuensis]MXP31001.1 phosphoribosylamine--glycine ligase [Parerythrobacter jejuensis]MXP33761.1 phosphoribosylamine--glycine ligase [Parerythrobacter jejuensis]